MSDGNGKEPFFRLNTQFDVSHILDRIHENIRLRKVLNLPDEGQPGGKPLPPSQAAMKDLDFTGLDAVWEKWLYVDSPYAREEGSLPKRLVKKSLNQYHKVFSRSQYFFNCFSKQLSERMLQSIHTLDHNVRELNHCVTANERHWTSLEEGLSARQNGLESVVNRAVEETSRARVEARSQMIELLEAVNGLRARVESAEETARTEKDRADALAVRLASTESKLSALAGESHAAIDQLRTRLESVQAEMMILNNRGASLAETMKTQGVDIFRHEEALAELNNAAAVLQKQAAAQGDLINTVSRQSEIAVGSAHRIAETVDRLREGFMRTEGKAEELARVAGANLERITGAEKWLGAVSARMDAAEKQIAENGNRSVRNEEWLKLVADRNTGAEKAIESLSSRGAEVLKQVAEIQNRSSRNEEWLKLVSDRVGAAEISAKEQQERLRACEVSGDRCRNDLNSVVSAVEAARSRLDAGDELSRSLAQSIEGNERWLKLVAEKAEAFNQRFDEGAGRVAEVKEALLATAERIEGVEKWLALVASKADAGADRMAQADQCHSALESRLNNHEGALSGLSSQVRNHEEWLTVNTGKIESLQNWNQALDGRISGVENRAGEWGVDAGRLHGVVHSVAERMANAEKWTSTLAGRLDGWEDWCGKLHARLQAQEAREGDQMQLNSEIDTLRNNTNLLGERVNGHEQWLKGVGDRLDGTERWVELASKKADSLGDSLVKVRREILSEMRYLQSERKAMELAPRILSPEDYARKVESMPEGLRVNVGSGNATIEDYINVDMRPLEGVDVAADVLNLPFEKETVAELYNAHLVEHFPRDLMRNRILPYWFGLIKPGGRIRVVCPNWDAILAKQASGEIDNERAIELTFGSQEYEGNLHLTLYTPKSLGEMLKSAGFRHIEVAAEDRNNDGCPEMELVAVKPAAKAAPASGKKAR